MPEIQPPSQEYHLFDPERQEIRVVVIHPPKRRYWLHALLFLATIFTTLCVGARMQFDFNQNLGLFSQDLDLWPWQWIWQDWSRLLMGIPFSLSLLGILRRMSWDITCFACDAAFWPRYHFLFRRRRRLGPSERWGRSSASSRLCRAALTCSILALPARSPALWLRCQSWSMACWRQDPYRRCRCSRCVGAHPSHRDRRQHAAGLPAHL